MKFSLVNQHHKLYHSGPFDNHFFFSFCFPFLITRYREEVDGGSRMWRECGRREKGEMHME